MPDDTQMHWLLDESWHRFPAGYVSMIPTSPGMVKEVQRPICSVFSDIFKLGAIRVDNSYKLA